MALPDIYRDSMIADTTQEYRVERIVHDGSSMPKSYKWAVVWYSKETNKPTAYTLFRTKRTARAWVGGTQ